MRDKGREIPVPYKAKQKQNQGQDPIKIPTQQIGKIHFCFHG